MPIHRLFSDLATTSGIASRRTALPCSRLVAICAVIFLTAFGIRLLYWQDNYAGIFGTPANGLQMMAPAYRDHAQRILDDGGLLAIRAPADPSDATTLVHPPGYPMLLVVVLKLFHREDAKHELAHVDDEVRVVQVICDALSSVVIFLIAAEFFPVAIAIIAAVLSSCSPHFGYYSLMLAPDSVSVLPILLAVFFLIRASKRPQLLTVISAGALVGVSCWLRSNALLLAPFLLLSVPLLFERGRRLRYSLALMCGAVLVIAPIIIRNWIVFHRFVPLSATAGRLLLEGIGNYDKENPFGSPSDEDKAALQEAQLYGRPDYAFSLWKPDGIERDQARFSRGLAAARSHPGWFFGVMLRRMEMMLRYNDFRRQALDNITIAPTLSDSANFGHNVETPQQTAPIWSRSSSELMANGSVVLERAQAALEDNNETLKINAAGSQYGDIFLSEPITVKRDTDYVFRVPVWLEQGNADVKIGTPNPRIVLALVSASSAVRNPKSRETNQAVNESASSNEQSMRLLLVPFASGDNTQVRLSLLKSTVEPTIVKLGRPDMFESGPTPYLWTRYPRAAIRGIQKNFFKTNVSRALIAIGIILLMLARRGRALAILLIVPAYYLLAQSPLHTEYRYILVIHYFLFVIGAVTIYYAGAVIGQSLRRGYHLARGKGGRLVD